MNNKKQYYREKEAALSAFLLCKVNRGGKVCHTIDQVISYFGMPDHVHYDVRQLLGPNRRNACFYLAFYYAITKDRQKEDLKKFYMPNQLDFGRDLPEHYGVLTYLDDQGIYHEEKVVSEVGDYSRVYQAIHDSIIHGAEKMIKDEETIRQIEILEEGIRRMKESQA